MSAVVNNLTMEQKIARNLDMIQRAEREIHRCDRTLRACGISSGNQLIGKVRQLANQQMLGAADQVARQVECHMERSYWVIQKQNAQIENSNLYMQKSNQEKQSIQIEKQRVESSLEDEKRLLLRAKQECRSLRARIEELTTRIQDLQTQVELEEQNAIDMKARAKEEEAEKEKIQGKLKDLRSRHQTILELRDQNDRELVLKKREVSDKNKHINCLISEINELKELLQSKNSRLASLTEAVRTISDVSNSVLAE